MMAILVAIVERTTSSMVINVYQSVSGFPEIGLSKQMAACFLSGFLTFSLAFRAKKQPVECKSNGQIQR